VTFPLAMLCKGFSTHGSAEVVIDLHWTIQII
jgi:hypothetical protein